MCNVKEANWSPCVCQRPKTQDDLQFFFQQVAGFQFPEQYQRAEPEAAYCDRVREFSLLSKSTRSRFQIEHPTAMSVDQDTGAMYLVDSSRNQLFKFTFPRDFPTAIRDAGYFDEVQSIIDETSIELVSGTKASGNADGPVERAQFNGPHSIAFDHISRAVFVADQFNSALRAVWPQQDVQTLVHADENFKPVAVAAAYAGDKQGNPHDAIILYAIDHNRKVLVAVSETSNVGLSSSSSWTHNSSLMITLVCILVIAMLVVFFNDVKYRCAPVFSSFCCCGIDL